jgi:hypothetical protein
MRSQAEVEFGLGAEVVGLDDAAGEVGVSAVGDDAADVGRRGGSPLLLGQAGAAAGFGFGELAGALEEGNPGRALAAAFSVMSDQDAQFPGLLRAVLSVPVLARAVFATAAGRRFRGMLATVPAEGRVVREADGTYGKYSRITAETLLIRGTQSAPRLMKATGLLAQAIPHATTVTLDGIGHNGPYEDAPDKVAGALRAFFAEAPPARADSLA